MKYYVDIEDQSYEIDIGPDGLRLDGRQIEVDLKSNHDSNIWHLVLDGRSHTLCARRRERRGEWDIVIGGRRREVFALDERSRAIRQLSGNAATSSGPLEVRAPMPGLVIKVDVVPGDQVEPGQALIVIEAMKMENELKATGAGRVKDIRVAAGQAVNKGEPLLVIEPAN